MDRRSIIGGLILIGAGCTGCALISTALSLPLSGFIGLLLLILPVMVFLWFLEMKINTFEEFIRSGNRQVRRDIEDQGNRVIRRFDGTMEEVEELNTELRRRIYR